MCDHDSHEVGHALGVFRRARRDDDELPERVAHSVLSAPAECQLRPTGSRAIRLTDPDRTWYVVPGTRAVGCYDEWGGGGVFDLATTLAGRGIATSFRGTGRLLITGLVPDQATDLRLVRRNGSRVVVDSHDNLYAILVSATAVEQLPDRIEFVLDDNEHSVDVPGADDEILTLRGANEAQRP